jgi:hypothetical protein
VEAQAVASAAVADSDGDGYTDAQEEAWATDPLDSSYHPDLETGIVGWWRFDEGAGTSVADMSGRGHAGTLTGVVKPQWTRDDTGVELAFNGLNCVSVPDAAELTPDGGLTLVTWIKVSPSATGQLVSKWRSGSNGSYALSVKRGRLVLELMLAGEYQALMSPTGIADNNWHHVAAVFDGREARLYLDGARVATMHTGGLNDVVSEPLRIGQVAGSLADVGVYARALPDGDVALLYEVSAGGSSAVVTAKLLRGIPGRERVSRIQETVALR